MGPVAACFCPGPEEHAKGATGHGYHTSLEAFWRTGSHTKFMLTKRENALAALGLQATFPTR